MSEITQEQLEELKEAIGERPLQKAIKMGFDGVDDWMLHGNARSLLDKHAWALIAAAEEGLRLEKMAKDGDPVAVLRCDTFPKAMFEENEKLKTRVRELELADSHFERSDAKYSREGLTLLILHLHDCDQYGVIDAESPDHLWFSKHGGYYKLSKATGEVETLKEPEF